MPRDHILLVQLLPQHRSDQREAHRTALYQAKGQDGLSVVQRPHLSTLKKAKKKVYIHFFLLRYNESFFKYLFNKSSSLSPLTSTACKPFAELPSVMTANEILFCFRIDFIQPDTVVVVDFGKFEEREEWRSWRMVGGKTM